MKTETVKTIQNWIADVQNPKTTNTALFLLGPHASGKTTLVHVIAQVLNKPLRTFSCGSPTYQDLKSLLGAIVVIEASKRPFRQMNDILASITTGASFKTSQVEIQVEPLNCPVIITGTSNYLPPDLMRRCCIVELEPIQQMEDEEIVRSKLRELLEAGVAQTQNCGNRVLEGGRS